LIAVDHWTLELPKNISYIETEDGFC